MKIDGYSERWWTLSEAIENNLPIHKRMIIDALKSDDENDPMPRNVELFIAEYFEGTKKLSKGRPLDSDSIRASPVCGQSD